MSEATCVLCRKRPSITNNNICIECDYAASKEIISILEARIKELEEKLKILLKGVPIDQAKDGEWYFVRTCSYRDPIRARWDADSELWEIGHEGGWAHEHTFKKRVLPAALLNEWDSEYGFPTPRSPQEGGKE